MTTMQAAWTPPVLAGPRPSGTLAKWAMILVGVTVAAIVFQMAAVGQGFSLIERAGSVTEYEILSYQENLTTATGMYAVAMLVSLVAVVTWLYRVVGNVPLLGGGTPNASPRASVLWWFVPFANFVMPPMIVSDVWKRLATRPGETSVVLVGTWWLLWLGYIATDRVIGSMAVETIDDFRTMLTVEVLALISGIVAGILLTRIIWEIERRSRLRAAALDPATAPQVMPGALPSANSWPAQPATAPFVAVAAPAAETPPIAPAVVPATPSTSGPAIGETGVAFCPRCGARRVAEARYCAVCGVDLTAIGPAPTS